MTTPQHIPTVIAIKICTVVLLLATGCSGPVEEQAVRSESPDTIEVELPKTDSSQIALQLADSLFNLQQYGIALNEYKSALEKTSDSETVIVITRQIAHCDSVLKSQQPGQSPTGFVAEFRHLGKELGIPDKVLNAFLDGNVVDPLCSDTFVRPDGSATYTHIYKAKLPYAGWCFFQMEHGESPPSRLGIGFNNQSYHRFKRKLGWQGFKEKGSPGYGNRFVNKNVEIVYYRMNDMVGDILGGFKKCNIRPTYFIAIAGPGK